MLRSSFGWCPKKLMIPVSSMRGKANRSFPTSAKIKVGSTNLKWMKADYGCHSKGLLSTPGRNDGSTTKVDTFLSDMYNSTSAIFMKEIAMKK
jgi:hypothetical protein